jgi:hypothetical protein
MQAILILIMSFLGFVGFILLPFLCWKWSFSNAVFFGIFSVISILYCFGLFSGLLMGVYFTLGLSIMLAGISILYVRKDFKGAFHRLICPPLIIFIVMVLFLCVLTRFWSFIEWDEFSHWGIFAKAMYLENKFPAQVSFVTVWPHYPPGISIVQYYITKLAGYSERNVYFAQNMVILASVIAVLKNVSWKKLYLAIGVTVFCYWLIYLWGYRLDSIYMDALLGVVFGSTIVVYFSDKERNWVSMLKIAPALIVLPLIKQAGFFFALIMCGLIFLDHAIGKSPKILDLFGKESLKRLFCAIPVFGFPLASFFSWSIFLRIMGVANITPGFQLSQLFRAFTGLATNYQQDVVRNFFGFLRTAPIGSSRLSVLEILFVFLVILLIYIPKMPSGKRKENLFIQTVLFLGFLCYAISLLFVYLSMPVNGERLQTLARYVGTYILGWSIVLFTQYYHGLLDVADDGLKKKQGRIPLIGYAFLLLMGINLTPLSTMLSKQRILSQRLIVYDAISPIVPKMDENSRVWLIWQGSNGFEFHIARYFIAPHTAQGTNGAFGSVLGKRTGPKDTWTVDLSPQELHDLVINQNFDYVFVMRGDQYFWETFGELFCGEMTADEAQLFRVETNCFSRVDP